MALKTQIQFPIFAPPNQPHHHRQPTEVRFSRWNNANADKFIRQERTQKQIEDELRFHKRFNSAHKIANIQDNNPAPTTTFKSIGTPSAPSRPSIPGKSSKYSKPPRNPKPSHPAFRRIVRIRKIPDDGQEAESGVKVGDNGVSYVIPEAPFEFQYSYTETPKAKPLKLREPPIAPFGPSTMPRPWTGKKPLPPSKKKLDFDSFQLPPPHKKGVKPVQAPGPFLPGSGPRYVQSREEILGEPLSKDEIEALVKGCMKSQRQLNMGRDGLTHNMLDNIHAHWKRRRVCKIKCKGVCTVDMDNVHQQLEEKTGGKIIHSRGGVLYLFRGRNYNYKTRPVFPLMLWKPVTPVYPRLIKQAPEGLTLEEASEMRKKGRQLTPICKLGKNGVYSDLVKNVKEAFEACELVRINCQGMNGSDYRKIGAKLKDIVPCVLISFEHEHILMWRGRDWKSSLPILEDYPQEAKKYETENEVSIAPPVEGQELAVANLSVKDATLNNANTNNDMSKEDNEDTVVIVNDSHLSSMVENTHKNSSATISEDQSESSSVVPLTCEILQNVSENTSNRTEIKSSPWTQGVELLLKQAVESGSAVVLDVSFLDADIVYEKAVALAQSAPPGPVFRHQRRKVAADVPDKQEAAKLEVKEVAVSERRESERRGPRTLVSESRESERSPRTRKKTEPKDICLDLVPRGRLRVDELAKLLA